MTRTWRLPLKYKIFKQQTILVWGKDINIKRFFTTLCFTNSSNEAGISINDSGDQMGHANTCTTEFYLASLNHRKTKGINDYLLKKDAKLWARSLL